ncbi:MAG: carboxypeptidase regulatory-like domain-containing protein, partial [Acidobacteria bacterium]|nr:carboxypeptidase regulatory-like domain-containing protein [Acidobacteriota bacterium]
MRRVLCVAVLTVTTALSVAAQITEAVLTGTVGDATGAVIAGAVVKAEHIRTGVVQETRSNEAGVYLFASLHPGAYRVSAEMQGFQRHVYHEVALEVGARLNLNFALEVGSMTQSVEVTATSENVLGYVTSSVGGMVTGQKVTDLPIPARDALSLVYIHAGLVGDNFSGARIGTLNISVDGINVQDNRINTGVASSLFNSTDRIEEFRVITSPVDAELGRGSGQIQMVSRSGGNEFHGSAFWSHRNTVLTANSFFNNLRGRDPVTGELVSPRDTLIRNQFGGRLGGPVRRNRTFFHFLYDAQIQRRAVPTTAVAYTEPARRGILRFYPGVLNQNALGSDPTVDLSGNPVRPQAATGDLQAVSLLGRDPNRMQADRTGVIKRQLDLMPLPNDFRSGDGLNTAGYRWRRSLRDDRDQYNLRLDHHFNAHHRMSFSFTWEDSYSGNGFMPQPFPASPGGESSGW